MHYNFSSILVRRALLRRWLTPLLLLPWLWGSWSTTRAEDARISGAECLRVLQEARRPALPPKITDQDAATRAMRMWDRTSSTNRLEVINELITWLPVCLEHPVFWEGGSFMSLHPAADILSCVGVETIEPLEKRLLTESEPTRAKVIAQLLQHSNCANFQDTGNTRLLALKWRMQSARLKGVIDEVDNETRMHADEELTVPLSITPGPNSRSER